MNKILRRKKRIYRARTKLKASNSCSSRLTLVVSNRNLSAHVYDLVQRRVLFGVTSASKANSFKGSKCEVALKLGELFGKSLKKKSINAVIFDRRGKKYTGVVKKFADAVRSQGVKI